MALNTLKCNHLIPVGLKGLNTTVCLILFHSICLSSRTCFTSGELPWFSTVWITRYLHVCACVCVAEIECGVPAMCSTSRLVAQTGRSFLDVAIYRCVADMTPAVTGIVCQLNGTWSPATTCVVQTSFVTPEHPFVPL